MIVSYQEHFDQRGSAYDLAMQRFPDARRSEFLQAIAAAQVQQGMVVGDVPAGGGYLKRFLPASCQWLGHEPCSSFTNHGARQAGAVPLLPLPWAQGSVDAAISVAGVHHIEDKRPLFADLHRVVRPGGRLAVSDVAVGSAVARFLDGYVGRHNSTGHEGVFLDGCTLDELKQAGWSVEQAENKAIHWVFENRADMADFCHALFDLRTSSQADTLHAIEATLGIDELPEGGVGMRWELMTIAAFRD